MTAHSTESSRPLSKIGSAIAAHDDVVVDVRIEGQPRLYLREFAEPVSPSSTYGPLDFMQSLAALTVGIGLTPVLLAVGAVVRVSSRGPVLFRQHRVGQNGKLFTCLKFRSMHTDAEERLTRLLEESDELRQEWIDTHKLQDDPRTSRVGRFLRKTSLDELPQLWNVVRGDMSIVGPRPVVPPESARYGDALPKVLTVKPGITGLWQVSGRNDLTYPERVELDLDYIDKKSVRLDISICFRTIWVLLASKDKGAY